MWITNREITRKNLYKLIYCAKVRDYIENQGFREQKITSGIDLKHIYSKDIKAIKVIYTNNTNNTLNIANNRTFRYMWRFQ